jgi:hypothetical protein
MIKCKICSSIIREFAKAKFFKTYERSLYVCDECEYITTNDPVWLDDAYKNSIATSDTGIVRRNLILQKTLSIIFTLAYGEKGSGIYLDYAGGSGLFVRLMRDTGFDFWWLDKYCSNILASNFTWDTNIKKVYKGVTAIEVIEHTIDPLQFIREILYITNSKIIIFTTTTYRGKPPSPDKWDYYSFYSGQHISFFSNRTLNKIAEKINLKYFGYRDLHIYSEGLSLYQKFIIIAAYSKIQYFLFPLIKLFLKSKTFSDNNLILNKK